MTAEQIISNRIIELQNILSKQELNFRPMVEATLKFNIEMLKALKGVK